LHDLNPERLAFIREHAALRGARALDVGCGGGLLSEAMAREGACVTGIDLAPKVLEVAQLHRLESGLDIEYRAISVEELAAERAGAYDLVASMEMLEHVPDPASVIRACASLLRPGGSLFVSTLNRTAAAFALAIVGAEYLARLLPRGTHRYSQFIRPAELGAWMRSAGLELQTVEALHYDPVRRRAWRGGPPRVNYLAWARKDA
jgi:2-polyprenyl-6-hydroxyphenyl methylase/3-demethylubiquinone-9 3-methyltransferase